MTDENSSNRDEQDKIALARKALAELDGAELADLLFEEFDRRRLDSEGDPKDTPGQYEAACTSMLALLGQLEGREALEAAEKAGWTTPRGWREQLAMAEDLAAVGRGERLNRKNQDTANQIRELAQLADASDAQTNVEAIAKTLDTKYGPVSREEVAAALRRETLNGKVTALAFAVGILDGDPDDEHEFRPACSNVGKYLKRGDRQ